MKSYYQTTITLAALIAMGNLTGCLKKPSETRDEPQKQGTSAADQEAQEKAEQLADKQKNDPFYIDTTDFSDDHKKLIKLTGVPITLHAFIRLEIAAGIGLTQPRNSSLLFAYKYKNNEYAMWSDSINSKKSIELNIGTSNYNADGTLNSSLNDVIDLDVKILTNSNNIRSFGEISIDRKL